MSAELPALLTAVLAAAPAGFDLPVGTVDAALGPGGTIVCLRADSPEIVLIDSSGSERPSWDLERAVLPVSVASLPDGSFLVCDAASSSVVRYTDRAETVETTAVPGGTCAIAADGPEIWCFSPDAGAVFSIPGTQWIADAEGFRPADLSLDGRRAVLSSTSGVLLIEPGLAVELPDGPSCLAGGMVFRLDGDSLREAGGTVAPASVPGGFDRIEGHPDGRILVWSAAGASAVLLE